jgi:hypothetical protein
VSFIPDTIAVVVSKVEPRSRSLEEVPLSFKEFAVLNSLLGHPFGFFISVVMLTARHILRLFIRG